MGTAALCASVRLIRIHENKTIVLFFMDSSMKTGSNAFKGFYSAAGASRTYETAFAAVCRKRATQIVAPF